MAWLFNLIRSSIGKKYIMAVTGALLGFFLVVHAAGNATSFWGREALNAYAGHLHSFAVPLKFFELLLGLFFLAHVLTAVLLYLENLSSSPAKYAISSIPPASWASRTMPYTGLLILVFVLLHLGDFHFTGRHMTTADMFKDVLGNPIYALFYIFSLGALTLHVSHGFWSLLQTLGLSHPKYDCLLTRGSLAAAMAIGLIFILIPVLIHYSSQFLQ